MYKIMTPGPTQVAENVRMARSRECTNPDLDESFVEFYKETCEKISRLLKTGKLLILGGELLVLGGELLFHHHDLGITVLNGHEILVLHVHVLAELGIGSGGQKAVDNVLHLGIARVAVFFDVHHLVVMAVLAALVKDAQHLL